MIFCYFFWIFLPFLAFWIEILMVWNVQAGAGWPGLGLVSLGWGLLAY